MLLVKLFPDEQDDKKSRHDADSRATLRLEFIAFIFSHLSMPMREPAKEVHASS
jgi:hypothetical protein